MAKKVYVNRTLNLKRINYIGLDMDHTLVRYNSANFEGLAHTVMLKKLVEMKDYPKSILNLKFDFERAIRGLVIDKNHGNILKLSRYSAIRASYHGLKPIDFKLQRKIYKSTYVDLKDSNYDAVDTTFSIAFATLYAQLVDLKDGPELSTLPDYNQLAEDLIFVLDRAHRDGSLKGPVEEDLDRYIIKDPEVVHGLEKFKKHDKKIFVLTNSDFHYSKLLLNYAINPFLKDNENWEDLFEFVITSAQKPRFFYDKLKFLKINPEDGTMTNLDSKLTPGIYQGGCANVFTSDLGLDAEEILYVGDHIYGDVVRLKKDCAWRTALVVEEIEEEIQKTVEAQPISNEINELMDQKFPLEIEIDKLISEQIELGNDSHRNKIDELIQVVTKIDDSLRPLIKKQNQFFNPYWGEVMRAGIEDSYLAHQVERFACIYMAKLTDLLETSPRTYFRSTRRQLPHDPS